MSLKIKMYNDMFQAILKFKFKGMQGYYRHKMHCSTFRSLHHLGSKENTRTRVTRYLNRQNKELERQCSFSLTFSGNNSFSLCILRDSRTDEKEVKQSTFCLSSSSLEFLPFFRLNNIHLKYDAFNKLKGSGIPGENTELFYWVEIVYSYAKVSLEA